MAQPGSKMSHQQAQKNLSKVKILMQTTLSVSLEKSPGLDIREIHLPPTDERSSPQAPSHAPPGMCTSCGSFQLGARSRGGQYSARPAVASVALNLIIGRNTLFTLAKQSKALGATSWPGTPTTSCRGLQILPVPEVH